MEFGGKKKKFIFGASGLLNMWKCWESGTPWDGMAAPRPFPRTLPSASLPSGHSWVISFYKTSNLLEVYPPFFFLTVGGVYHPPTVPGLGFAWIVGQVLCACGCYAGDPSKRNQGALGSLTLMLWWTQLCAPLLSILVRLKLAWAVIPNTILLKNDRNL